MAEPIGALRALLSASASVFESDMKKSRDAVRNSTNDMRTSFEKLEKQANRAINNVFSLRGAVAALAGATGLYYATKEAIKFADAIGDSAKVSGQTAEEYQKLLYAATQNGVEQESWNKAISKFNALIGDAKRGSESAQKVLNSFGIDKVAVQTKTTSENLLTVSDRFAGMTTAAERASAAADLFGEKNRAVGNFLALGAKGIEEFTMRAQQLGIVLSNETVAAAQDANDELETMQQVIKVGLTNAALQFLPLLRELAKIVTSPAFIGALGEIANITARLLQITRELAPQLAGVAAGILAIKMSAGKATPAQTALFATMAGAAAYLGTKYYIDNAKAVEGVGKASETAAGGVDEFTASLDTEGQKLLDNTKLLQMKNEQLRTTILYYRDGGIATNFRGYDLESEALEKNIDLTTKAGRAWGEARLKQMQLGDELEQVKRIVQETAEPIEVYKNEMQELNNLLNKNYITQEQYNRAMEQARDRYSEAQSKVKGLAGAGKEMGDAFGSAFEKMITGTETFSESLKGLARELINIALKKAILEPAGAAVSGIFGSLTGGISSAFGKWFGGARAKGGMTYPGKSYLVGEKGPELWTAGAVGNVTPNNALGNGGNTYYIDATGADAGAVQRIEAALMRLAGPGVVERRVQDARARGKI